MDDTTLIAFKAIASFVNNLSEEFGKRQKSLALYGRLIQKTGVVHEKPILKHLDAFRSFCVSNREAISSLDKNKISQSRISYSENVYIDISHVFNMADKETSDIIWKHILTISALVDPANNAKQILKENISKKKETGEPANEDEFLSSLIEKVESSIDPNSMSEDPMQAVNGLMSSGVFTELIGSMQSGLSNGNLDITKLLGSVQNMMGKMNPDAGAGNAPGMPDLSSMFSMLGAMGGMGGGGMGGGFPGMNFPAGPSSFPSITEMDETKE